MILSNLTYLFSSHNDSFLMHKSSPKNWLIKHQMTSTIKTIMAIAICSILAIQFATAQQHADLFVGTGMLFSNQNQVLAVPNTITANGTIDGDANGIIYVNGSSEQTIDGSSASVQFGQIDIANPAGIQMGIDINLTASTGLSFTSGAITLNNYDLNFGPSSNWSGNNTTTKYFVTNGTGLVSAENVAGALTYPIGFSLVPANYQPLTITNTGTPDAIGVRVQNHMSTAYNSSNGNASGSNVTTNGVGLAWVINEAVAGGSNLSLTAQWDGADELSGFNRAATSFSYYNYGTAAWVGSTNIAAAGTDPYTLTKSGFNQSMSYRIFGIGGPGVLLPVTLLNFNVVKSGTNANVNWETASEKNAAKFEIERSFDGETFEYTGEVAATGNSQSVQTYSFIDNGVGALPNATNVYYRLREVDEDGAFSYSAVRSVVFTQEAVSNIGEISVFPNPSIDNFTLSLSNSSIANATLQLIDMTGRTVWFNTTTITNAAHAEIAIPAAHLASGTYLLVVSGDASTKPQQISIIKN